MYEEWLEKMRRWCSLRERCTWDVEQKLRPHISNKSTVNQIVDSLVRDDFLSDERFLASYVRTHAEHKSWGPRKIVQGLRAKGFSGGQAEEAVAQYSEEGFRQILDHLILRRKADLATHREKVIRFLVSRGFSVNDILKGIEEAEGH